MVTKEELEVAFNNWKASELTEVDLLKIIEANVQTPGSEYDCFLEGFEGDLDVVDDLEEVFRFGRLDNWDMEDLLFWLNNDDPDFKFKDELIDWLEGYVEPVK